MTTLVGEFRIRKGVKSDLPDRANLAEPLFVTDTGELFIGQGPDQPPQKIGKTDYELWLGRGNTGTLEDFYASTSRQAWQQADW